MIQAVTSSDVLVIHHSAWEWLISIAVVHKTARKTVQEIMYRKVMFLNAVLKE